MWDRKLCIKTRRQGANFRYGDFATDYMTFFGFGLPFQVLLMNVHFHISIEAGSFGCAWEWPSLLIHWLVDIIEEGELGLGRNTYRFLYCSQKKRK